MHTRRGDFAARARIGLKQILTALSRIPDRENKGTGVPVGFVRLVLVFRDVAVEITGLYSFKAGQRLASGEAVSTPVRIKKAS